MVLDEVAMIKMHFFKLTKFPRLQSRLAPFVFDLMEFRAVGNYLIVGWINRKASRGIECSDWRIARNKHLSFLQVSDSLKKIFIGQYASSD